MSSSCRFEGCTVDDTGSCALENSASTCSHRTLNDAGSTVSVDALDYNEVALQSINQLGAPVLVEPTSANAFGVGRTLGLEDINTLMGTRYVNVVGILGDPESGKTACLASLYLLVSHAALEGWSFADSRSLMAFEDIARGAREWNNGQVPEQMTVHTELADDRSPGFLHLRLKRLSDGRNFDLALPDIPGEWTQALVTTAQSERLDFIKSAEVIWVVVDGRTLADLKRRQGLIARVGQLAGRLNTMLDGRVPKMLLVVTHNDSYTIDNNISVRLKKELTRRGVSAEIICVAPFSDRPEEVKAGFGIAELINKTIDRQAERPTFWQSNEPNESSRAYMSYRRDR